MAVTTAASSTQTATLDTEHTLHDTSAAGTYTLDVDTVNMATGDLLKVRIYKMVVTAGTRRIYVYQEYFGAQPANDLIKTSIPVSTSLTDSGALRFTIEQTDGTGRNFPYTVLKYS
jgi:hypothetical protein